MSDIELTCYSSSLCEGDCATVTILEGGVFKRVTACERGGQKYKKKCEIIFEWPRKGRLLWSVSVMVRVLDY